MKNKKSKFRTIGKYTYGKTSYRPAIKDFTKYRPLPNLVVVGSFQELIELEMVMVMLGYNENLDDSAHNTLVCHEDLREDVSFINIPPSLLYFYSTRSPQRKQNGYRYIIAEPSEINKHTKKYKSLINQSVFKANQLPEIIEKIINY